MLDFCREHRMDPARRTLEGVWLTTVQATLSTGVIGSATVLIVREINGDVHRDLVLATFGLAAISLLLLGARWYLFEDQVPLTPRRAPTPRSGETPQAPRGSQRRPPFNI